MKDGGGCPALYFLIGFPSTSSVTTSPRFNERTPSSIWRRRPRAREKRVTVPRTSCGAVHRLERHLSDLFGHPLDLGHRQPERPVLPNLTRDPPE